MTNGDARRAAREAEKTKSGGRWAIVGAAGLLVVGGAGLWAVTAGGTGGTPSSCESTVRIAVAATPEMARALEHKPIEADSCVRLDVVEQSSAQTAERASSGQLSEPLWIPDSSGRVDESGFDDAVQRHTPSLASSPVVVASADGSEDLPGTWTELLEENSARMGDPLDDGGAQAAMQAVTAEAQSEKVDPAAAQKALTLRAQTQDVSSPLLDATGLLEAVEQDGGQSIVAEHDLLDDDAASDLRAGVPDSGTAFLDYPLMVTSGSLSSSNSVQTAADEIAAWFETDEGREALADAGLRPADGAPLEDDRSIEIPERLEIEDRAAYDQVAETYDRQSAPLNALVVVDASGSMGEEEDSGQTRWDSTMGTLSMGAQLFPARDSLGLWLFSRDMGPEGEPYIELQPVRGIEEEVPDEDGLTQREALQAEMAQAEYKEGGETELYETTLAAFREQQRNWQPGQLNAVILVSDGGQQVYGQDGPMRMEELISTLEREQDPAKPVRIVTLGISDDADQVALGAIAGVTGGTYHQATDEQQLQQAFLEGLSTVDR